VILRLNSKKINLFREFQFELQELQKNLTNYFPISLSYRVKQSMAQKKNKHLHPRKKFIKHVRLNLTVRYWGWQDY